MDAGSPAVLRTDSHSAYSLSLLDGFIIILSLWILIKLLKLSSQPKLKLPPGPPSWPIIGSLPYVGRSLYKGFQKLSDKYGGVMYLEFGVHPFIVISSVEAAEELFKHHDRSFADRPRQGPFDTAMEYAGSNGRDLVLSLYNDDYRTLKKICMTEIFAFPKLSQSEHIRKEVLKGIIQEMSANSVKNEPSELRLLFRKQQLTVLCKLLFGKQITEVAARGSGELLSDMMILSDASDKIAQLFGRFNAADLLCPKWMHPVVKWLDPQGIIRQWKRTQANMHETLTKLIEEHKQTQRTSEATGIGYQKDFLHTLLIVGQGKIDETQVLALCTDLMAAGIDTSASVLHWCFIFLLRNPKCLCKLQAEMDSVIGQDRVMEEKDIHSLPYLRAVVKETLRLRPPVPTTLPRSNFRAEKLAGYDVPSNCVLMVNIYAISHNPSVWKNPEEFNPDRFLESEEDFNYAGGNYKYIPFGSGRRGCIGMNLAIFNVCCTLGSIFHALDISLPPNQAHDDILMGEDNSFILAPAHPTCVNAKRRPAYVNYASKQSPPVTPAA